MGEAQEVRGFTRRCGPALAAALAAAVLAAPHPGFTARDPIAETRADLEQEERRVGDLADGVADGLETIERRVVEGLEAQRKRLLEEVSDWREERRLEGLSSASEIQVDVREIRRAVAEAEAVGRASGLPVERLSALYERTKEIIRKADFAVPGRPDFDRDERLSTRVANLLTFAHDYEEAIAEARLRHQLFKVGLYKNVSFAYIDALLAAGAAPAPCDGAGEAAGTLRIDGIAIPSRGCPDRVVQRLRDYLDAVRTIRDADAETLCAEAELVVAEQQLAADLLSGVPLVGDALDIYAVYSGEDLAGTALPAGVRQVVGVLVLLPLVNGPAAQSMFDQLAKRSHDAAVAMECLNDFFRAVEFTASDAWFRFKWGTRDAGQVAWDEAAKQLGVASDALRRLAEELRARWPKAGAAAGGGATVEQRLWQKVRDAIDGKLAVRELPPELREKLLQRAERNVREGILDMQGTVAHAIRDSGIHKDHVDAFRVAAMESEQIIIMRASNPDAARRLDEFFAATKHMGIKSKSASEGPIAAFIPVNQSLNKLGSDLEEAILKRERGGSAEELARLERQITDLKKQLRTGSEEMQKCLAHPDECAQAIVWQVPSPLGEGKKDLLMVKDRRSGRQVFGVEGPGGRLVDHETGRALDIDPVGRPQKVEILATADGVPITADYDVLNFGRFGADYEKLRVDKLKGGYTDSQGWVIDRINELIGHPGGNVVHHGGEENFFKSRGVDFPLTVFEPDGRVLTIPACDAACMTAWCRRNPTRCRNGSAAPDPGRLLKDYFHYMKLQDFNLDPNPRWGWGPFSPLGGFAARIAEVAW